MLNLTFGEQVKIILSRKGMTIKELAEIIEERTGKKMSRQNLTQRLGRDNFQEQDMRMIADILGCPFQLSILADSESVERASNIETVEPTKKELSKLARAKERKEKRAKESEKARLADAMDQIPSEMEREPAEKEMTLGDYIEIHEELQRQETAKLPKVAEEIAEEAPVYEEPVYEEPAETAPVMEASEEVPAYEEAAEEEPTPEEPEEAPTYVEAVYEEAAAEEQAVENQDEVHAYGEPVYEEPAQEGMPEGTGTAMDDIESVMRELEELEKSSSPKKQDASARTNREEKKSSGWRGMFQRRNKREEQERERREREQREQERLEAERREQLLAEEYGRYEEQPAEETYESYDEPAAEENYYGQQTYEEPAYEQPVYEEPVYEEAVYEEEDEDAEDLTKGERNPYTNHEYETNSVRMHPKRIGYVQVYDRKDHAWTDMTEWAFLGYQERKKALLGKDYEPPIYLD